MARVRAQAHRAAHTAHLSLFRHQVYHRIPRVRNELRRIRFVIAKNIPAEFYDHDLHAEAQSQIRYATFSGISRGPDHSLDAAIAEPTGDHDSLRGIELRFPAVALQRLGGDPDYVHMFLM